MAFCPVPVTEPQWLPTPCDECGSPADEVARRGARPDAIAVCRACLQRALEERR